MRDGELFQLEPYVYYGESWNGEDNETDNDFCGLTLLRYTGKYGTYTNSAHHRPHYFNHYS